MSEMIYLKRTAYNYNFGLFETEHQGYLPGPQLSKPTTEQYHGGRTPECNANTRILSSYAIRDLLSGM